AEEHGGAAVDQGPLAAGPVADGEGDEHPEGAASGGQCQQASHHGKCDSLSGPPAGGVFSRRRSAARRSSRVTVCTRGNSPTVRPSTAPTMAPQGPEPKWLSAKAPMPGGTAISSPTWAMVK